jgi:hypothetical protein
MIDFCRLHFRKDAPQGGSIGKIAVMEEETLPGNVLVAAQMLDARAQEITGPPDNSMNRVPLFEEQFRQVRPILTGDAGDKRSLWTSIHQKGFRLAPINEGLGSHKGEPANSSSLSPRAAKTGIATREERRPLNCKTAAQVLKDATNSGCEVPRRVSPASG